MFPTSTRIRATSRVACLLGLLLAAVPAAHAAWLGVQLQPVPDLLAAHTKLPDGGLLVQNVLRDGPADRAGLDRWDIITAMDGRPVTSDLTVFTAESQRKPAGETITLSYIHAGQSTTATVTLGERFDPPGEADWKYDSEQQDILQERIRVRGHALTKDDRGNWMLRDLPDFPEALSLPGDLRELFQGITMHVSVSNDEKGGHRVNISREESDGEKIQVTIQGDEPILVRRTRITGGQESTTEETYADMDALRQADPEVYEMLDGTRQRGMLRMSPFGPDVDPRALRLESLRRMESQLNSSSQALADYLEALTKEFGAGAFGVAGNKGLTILPRPFGSDQKSGVAFRVQPDGQIEVTRRTGDIDLTDVYRDEQDLKTRDPATYEQYQSLRAD